MADTLLGAVREYLVTRAPAGTARSGAAVTIGGRIWRSEQVPEGATLPYVSITDLGASPALSGDQRTLARRAGLSVDVWQRSRDYSASLLREVVGSLDGAKLPLQVGRAMRTRVTQVAPIPEPEGLLVHHAVTISLATDPHAF